MPTKPAVIPPIWASNATWTVGQHAGTATKVAPSAGEAQNGQVGGQSYKGQWDNYMLNLLSTWAATWLALGTSAADADAHIVETDAGGTASLQRLLVSQTDPALLVGISAIVPGSNVGIEGTGGTTGGSGIRGLTRSAASAVFGGPSGGGTGIGVEGIGGNGSAGVYGEGGGFAPGVEGAATSGNAPGVRGTGFGTGAGLEGTGGSTGEGVRGIAGGVNASGVVGDTDGAATEGDRAGVWGRGFGEGRGVWGEGANGYGVVAESDTTTPMRSAMRIVPQNADPTTALDGDLFYSDELFGGVEADELRLRSRGGWRSVMWETSGYVRAFGINTGTVTATTASVAITALSGVSLSAPQEPRRTGTVWIRLAMEVGRASGAGQDIIVRIRDATAGATVAVRTITLHQAAVSWERHVALLVPYTLPAVGARSFEVEIETTSSANNVRARDTTLQIYGVV